MKETDFDLLNDDIALMEEAVKVLQYSYDKCKDIEISDRMNMDEQESFEALTGRFARAGDILIQKLFRHIDIPDLEKPGTVRDRIHRAEKKGIIASAGDMITIRNLRNDIAHEYLQESIRHIWKSVLLYTPFLITAFQNLKEYAQRYGGD